MVTNLNQGPWEQLDEADSHMQIDIKLSSCTCMVLARLHMIIRLVVFVVGTQSGITRRALLWQLVLQNAFPVLIIHQSIRIVELQVNELIRYVLRRPMQPRS